MIQGSLYKRPKSYTLLNTSFMDESLNSVRIWPTHLGEVRDDHFERYSLACQLISKGSTVIDAACGVGYGSRMLHDAGLKVRGYDISQQAISWAEKYFPIVQDSEFVCCDILSLQARADFLVCFETLEHLEDPLGFLNNVRAAYIIASVPNEVTYPFEPHQFAGDEYPHKRHYTPDQFDSLLREAGYTVEYRFSQRDKRGKVELGVEGRFIIYIARNIRTESHIPSPPQPTKTISAESLKLSTDGDVPDICFFVAEVNRGHILDRMAREIAKAFSNAVYNHTGVAFPKARRHFVTHYSLLPLLFNEVNPQSVPSFCLFTHNKGHLGEYVQHLNLCKRVIAENLQGVETLVEFGVRKEIITFVPECADPIQFTPQRRSPNGAILICGKNYPDNRKNPELIARVVAKLRHRSFAFLGSGWEAMAVYRNARLLSEPYSKYPAVYQQCSVYLSASKLEGGGPNSLIEAMHSNLVPVASDTGNSRDYISHGANGYIFASDATADDVCTLIEQAFTLDVLTQTGGKDVYQTVSGFTWHSYASKVKDILNQQD
jgi:glycosyltransferase involved in cell wall biosynthesis